MFFLTCIISGISLSFVICAFLLSDSPTNIQKYHKINSFIEKQNNYKESLEDKTETKESNPYVEPSNKDICIESDNKEITDSNIIACSWEEEYSSMLTQKEQNIFI